MGVHLHDHGTDVYCTCSRRINGCVSCGCQCSTYSANTYEQLWWQCNGDTYFTDDHTCVLWDKDLYVHLYGLLRSYKDLGLCLYDQCTSGYDACGWQQRGKLCSQRDCTNATGGNGQLRKDD